MFSPWLWIGGMLVFTWAFAGLLPKGQEHLAPVPLYLGIVVVAGVFLSWAAPWMLGMTADLPALGLIFIPILLAALAAVLAALHGVIGAIWR